MTTSPENDVVGFNEFTTRVQKLTSAALRQAEILEVKPEPSAKAYQYATMSERFIAYIRSGMRRREAFETWLQREAEYLKQYHDDQWIERTIKSRLYSQEYLENDIPHSQAPPAGTAQTGSDVAT